MTAAPASHGTAAGREKRSQPGARSAGPWHDTDTTLRRLARGEPLPELPDPEET